MTVTWAVDGEALIPDRRAAVERCARDAAEQRDNAAAARACAEQARARSVRLRSSASVTIADATELVHAAEQTIAKAREFRTERNGSPARTAYSR